MCALVVDIAVQDFLTVSKISNYVLISRMKKLSRFPELGKLVYINVQGHLLLHLYDSESRVQMTHNVASAGLTHKHTKHVLRAPTGEGAPRTTLG